MKKTAPKPPTFEFVVNEYYTFFRDHLHLVAGRKRLSKENKIAATESLAKLAAEVLADIKASKAKKERGLAAVTEALVRLRSNIREGIV